MLTKTAERDVDAARGPRLFLGGELTLRTLRPLSPSTPPTRFGYGASRAVAADHTTTSPGSNRFFVTSSEVPAAPSMPSTTSAVPDPELDDPVLRE